MWFPFCEFATSITATSVQPYLYCRKQSCLHSQDGRPLDQPNKWTPWQPGNNIVIINTNITVLIILIVTVIITTNKIIHILIILIVSIIINGTFCGWLCSWKTSSSLDGIPSVINMIAWFDSAENWNRKSFRKCSHIKFLCHSPYLLCTSPSSWRPRWKRCWSLRFLESESVSPTPWTLRCSPWTPAQVPGPQEDRRTSRREIAYRLQTSARWWSRPRSASTSRWKQHVLRCPAENQGPSSQRCQGE